MRFTFTVEVEVERIEGKFASREELADQIYEALAQAQLDSVEGGMGGQYEVTVWEVDEAPQERKRPARNA